MLTWTTLTFTAGAEWAPGSSFGLDTFRLDGAGRFHYENRTRGETKSAAGNITPVLLNDIGWHLEQAGFPGVPAHDIPPGASLVEFTLDDVSGSRTARMDYFAARNFPGYRELLVRFDRWTAWLRDGANGASPPGLIRKQEALS
ncbi:MAG TPA: hypothetical protein VF275_01425 [Gammaproteobacteria bacterium]